MKVRLQVIAEPKIRSAKNKAALFHSVLCKVVEGDGELVIGDTIHIKTPTTVFVKLQKQYSRYKKVELQTFIEGLKVRDIFNALLNGDRRVEAQDFQYKDYWILEQSELSTSNPELKEANHNKLSIDVFINNYLELETAAGEHGYSMAEIHYRAYLVSKSKREAAPVYNPPYQMAGKIQKHDSYSKPFISMNKTS
jgi:hypothetical protein